MNHLRLLPNPFRLQWEQVEFCAGRDLVLPNMEAVAYEEDTFLVLSAEPVVRPRESHIIRVMTDLIEQEENEPGTVILREGKPAQLLCVVHDLSRDPSMQTRWVRQAYLTIMRFVEDRGIENLATQMLGSVFGRLEEIKSLQYFIDAWQHVRPPQLKQVQLLTESETLLPSYHQAHP
ncbi:MAG: hypothetical protein H6510_17115 [Acidobacteria bacterium]|nr:hypothetical protein [Acidobacteriota bacterium]